MMIIWGARSYFRTSTTKQFGFCHHCGRYSKFRSWNGTNCFHLYYIPVIPLEGRRRNHACCSRCDAVVQFSIPEFEAANIRLKEQAASALLAILNGEATFFLDQAQEIEVESLAFLKSAFEWLHAANELDFIQGIMEQLRQPSFRYAELCLAATLATLKGELDEAVAHFRHAAHLEPKRSEPLHQTGRLLKERNKPEEAIEAFLAAVKLAEDVGLEFTIRMQLTEIMMNQKRFIEADECFQRILEIHPGMADDKAFSKQAAKASKKAAAQRPIMPK